MRNKIGLFCMTLGTVCIAAALSLFLWNQRADQSAGASVDSILPQVEQCVAQTPPENDDPYDTAMTEVEIDGYAYIGYLSIPDLGLELPVMSDWDYTRLKIAPCRYSGSTKSDDLVIAAHNYTRHFRSLKRLSIGAEVTFTDMDGVVSVYEVVATDILAPTDVAEMTAGDYDLTLFTCTYGNRSRVTVRCERAGEVAEG